MNTHHAKIILENLRKSMDGGEDRQLSSEEIREVLSAASALVSEAVSMAEGSTEFGPDDEWVLDALSLASEDKLFRSAFVELCKINAQRLAKLYEYACLFLYRGMMRGNVPEVGQNGLRSALEGNLSENMILTLFEKLDKAGLFDIENAGEK